MSTIVTAPSITLNGQMTSAAPYSVALDGHPELLVLSGQNPFFYWDYGTHYIYVIPNLLNNLAISVPNDYWAQWESCIHNNLKGSKPLSSKSSLNISIIGPHIDVHSCLHVLATKPVFAPSVTLFRIVNNFLHVFIY